MDHVISDFERNSLPISLRLMRLILGFLLLFSLAVEKPFSEIWELVLTFTCAYALITGLFGKDPLFAILRLSIGPLPDYTLNVLAQLECLSVGVICIVAGILNFNVDSVVVLILPFIGIYPIMLCAIKHDLLGYLILSYRNDRKQSDDKNWSQQGNHDNEGESQY